MKRERNDEASQRLLDACKQKGGDVDAVWQALKDGANVNVRSEGRPQWSPLMYVTHPKYGSNLKIAQILIDAGCKIDDVNALGDTTLSLVVSYQIYSGNKDVSMVKALLRAGANPNITDVWGETPCHNATTVEVLELLLYAGGDPRVVCKAGKTPYQKQRHLRGGAQQLRPVFEAWTPHRMLPMWKPSAFPLYVEECDGFKRGIFMLLLCLRRYRHMIPKEVGMMIVHYVAEMHRREMWWPSWQDFSMEPYM